MWYKSQESRDYSCHFTGELTRHKTKMHNTGENLEKCDKCVYQTTTKPNLKRHNEWKHEEHQACALCPFSGCKTSVAAHMRNKHGQLNKCSLCNFQGSKHTQMEQHFNNKHQGIEFHCDECDSVLVSLMGLKMHKENKHGKIRYQCPKCDYKATLKANLNIHNQAMHEGIYYPCYDCSYTASTQRSLSLHKKAKHISIAANI